MGEGEGAVCGVVRGREIEASRARWERSWKRVRTSRRVVVALGGGV
jgi:predicted PP-loop superfamily ATPase